MAATNTGNPEEILSQETLQALFTYQSTHSDLNGDNKQVKMIAAALLELVIFTIDDDAGDVLIQENQNHTDHCRNESGKP